MHTLNLPKYEFKLREGNTIHIFDSIRKKYVVLTPEEWVRQNFLTYLVSEKNYPKTLIKIEHIIKVNKTQKRCDAVVYNSAKQPRMIIEFKKPGIKIDQTVFDQIARYNIALSVKYLMISNGLQHYCCCVESENQSCRFLDQIPDYKLII